MKIGIKVLDFGVGAVYFFQRNIEKGSLKYLISNQVDVVF
jgi:hypothetical protein